MGTEHPSLTVRLLGTFEVLLDGKPLLNIATREGDRLLALLCLSERHIISTQILAETLWPATSSLDSLRQGISQLRRVLGTEGERLQTPKGMVTLELSGVEVDLLEFDAAIAHADSASLQRAVKLYRGPLLQGWTESWAHKERERRQEGYVQALRRLAEICIENRDMPGAASYLRRYVALRPADEQAWCLLMEMLIQAGNRVAAIDIYHTYRNYLHSKYQIAPSEAMTRKYRLLHQIASCPAEEALQTWAGLEPTGGAVPIYSECYIERPEDQLFYTAIARRDSVVLVKGARQTGKSSLLARGLQQARDLGARIVLTDLQKISSAHWDSANQFLKALAQNLADQLNLPRGPADTWSDLRGANENFEWYVRRELLDRETTPVVWGMDEVDRLFRYPFCSDVFALMRAWHNARALDPHGPWERFTLTLAYATEAHLFISDLNQSPFNVGTRLLLSDFTVEQAANLDSRYNAPLGTPERIGRFYQFVGGNPYLLRRGLYELTTHKLSISDFERQAVQDTGCYGDHLQRLLTSLQQDTGLCSALREMLRGKSCPTQESFYRLKSAGLIIGETRDVAQVRCQLYQIYLGAHLI